MDPGRISVRGARVHNLKNVSLELPKNQLICFTGVSGSGKSSMAFDTLYAEGQRRYVASLSSYARQFLGQMEKPDVDRIDGLAPTISISQKSGGHNPRSTVGTITEIYDYLRVLFARCGTPHCAACGSEIGAQTRDQIVSRIAALPPKSSIHVLAPIVQERKGEYHELFDELLKDGYLRVRVDGQLFNLEHPPELDRYSRHNIEVVIDRLTIKASIRSRLEEAVDGALRMGDGTLIVHVEDADESASADSAEEETGSGGTGKDWLISANFDCPSCGISYQEQTPQMFSFNNPQGMCPDCAGLGNKVVMSERLIVPDDSKSIMAGAVEPLGEVTSNRWRLHLYEGLAEHLGFSLETPWKKLTREHRDRFLHGMGTEKIEFTYTNQNGYSWSHNDRYDGALQYLEERLHSSNARARRELSTYVRSEICSTCTGGRLKKQALAVSIDGENLPQLTGLPIERCRSFFDGLTLEGNKALIAEDALKEIRGRLALLVDIGLGYLTLDRGAHTLSGGESQRIRLASQIGSGLVGVLYVLDEPSIGLHSRDNQKLLLTLQQLRDVGNTVVVVEHDEDTMRQADILVDFGPGAGDRGGHLVASGTPEEVMRCNESQTARYLTGASRIEIPAQRRLPPPDKFLTVMGAQHNNLKDLTVRLPLSVFTCVTGVSGSGKSSLVNDILFKALDRDLHGALGEPGAHADIKDVSHLDKVIRIDQKPIGRTPRSNPATYTDVLTPIRQLLAQLPDARLRGYKQGRFSFNVPGGRCEACDGNGANLVQMEFLADVWVTCETCEGRRFNRETQTIKFRDHSISDILNLEVEEATQLFDNVPPVKRILQTLCDVGLGYVKLGQPAPTLSGGEAQRVKLAKELARASTGRTLYLLDEPTTGLHFSDIEKLLGILHTFVDQGNTVIVIEHNMEVIKTADYVIDMGPEGGEQGGLVLATGTPEEIAEVVESHTGQALVAALEAADHSPKAALKNGKTPAKSAGSKPAGWIREIEVVGARMHNLRDVSVRVPRDQMTVISGVSGSGKSSLAFDTIYAEGQRRYVESLSAYARQFLAQMQKPKVERITGLSPAVAIEQKSPSKNPRSTVGTVTEVSDYVRAMYATIGSQHCPRCDVPVGTQTVAQMVDRILLEPERHVMVLAPLEPVRNEGYEALLQRARRDGFGRVRIDEQVHELGEEEIQLERRHRHRVEVVVDRIVVRDRDRARIAEAVERALELSGGEMVIATMDNKQTERFSRRFSCPACGTGFDPLVPQSFSFNHREGMCETCEGLGVGEGVDRELLLPNRRISVREGAIAVWGPIEPGRFSDYLEACGDALGFDLDTPVAELSAQGRQALLYGSTDSVEIEGGLHLRFAGVFPTADECARHHVGLKGMMQDVPCSACQGSRLKTDSRFVYLRDTTIVQLLSQPIGDCLAFFDRLQLDTKEQETSGELHEEIRKRLHFLSRVGLDYISLDRRAATLSGGEGQRIRLAGQIGSGLTGVLYLLDEPTIGLHPRDNRRLLDALEELVQLGNTVIMVEHDKETLEAADHIIDLGPGAGTEGGHLVASGPPQLLASSRWRKGKSLTADYLRGDLTLALPKGRRKRARDREIRVIGARQNNLKNVDVTFPLGLMICVTGVSGSGKSSLVQNVLHNGLASALQRSGGGARGGEYDQIEGLEYVDKVINIDQAPIGQSPRSTPATVMGVFDLIRQLFAKLPEALVRGFKPGRFSFNRAGGRCESCEGLGWRCIEMHFLPDVWVRCEACLGQRYANEILQIRFKGHSIAAVLEMTVSQNLKLFANVTGIRERLQVMEDVGLGYMTLGQSSTTLSGGEAQRLKLAAELARPDTGDTFYIMDEPTTGLHFADIQKLLLVVERLVEGGNTVVIVEHNIDVIKTADYIIDMGPEGGADGGRVVVSGTPEKVARSKRSHTGKVLSDIL